jgi:hypothetical protein
MLVSLGFVRCVCWAEEFRPAGVRAHDVPTLAAFGRREHLKPILSKAICERCAVVATTSQHPWSHLPYHISCKRCSVISSFFSTWRRPFQSPSIYSNASRPSLLDHADLASEPESVMRHNKLIEGTPRSIYWIAFEIPVTRSVASPDSLFESQSSPESPQVIQMSNNQPSFPLDYYAYLFAARHWMKNLFFRQDQGAQAFPGRLGCCLAPGVAMAVFGIRNVVPADNVDTAL